jgi:hypothetical protein
MARNVLAPLGASGASDNPCRAIGQPPLDIMMLMI